MSTDSAAPHKALDAYYAAKDLIADARELRRLVLSIKGSRGNKRPVVTPEARDTFDRAILKFSEHLFELQGALPLVGEELSQVAEVRIDKVMAAGVGGEYPLDAIANMAGKLSHGLLMALCLHQDKNSVVSRAILTEGNCQAVRDYLAAITDRDLIEIEKLLGQAKRDARAADRAADRAGRIRIVENSRDIIVDGIRRTVEPCEYQFIKALVDAKKKEVWWVSGKTIKKLPRCGGKKPSDILAGLRKRIGDVVESKGGTGFGFRLRY